MRRSSPSQRGHLLMISLSPGGYQGRPPFCPKLGRWVLRRNAGEVMVGCSLTHGSKPFSSKITYQVEPFLSRSDSISVPLPPAHGVLRTWTRTVTGPSIPRVRSHNDGQMDAW